MNIRRLSVADAATFRALRLAGGPGVLAVNEDLPPAVPEPGDATMMMADLAALLTAARPRRNG